MASGSTPTYLIPYPLPTDPVNVASDMEEMADRLEILFGTTVQAATANTFTNTNIFSVNSASTAVRITQVGSGNALLVEDDTNPDTSAFVITNAGDVGIGKLSPQEKVDVIGNIKLSGTLIFEGTDDTYELSFAYTDPTADRTITLPDVTGTVITTGNLSSINAVGTIGSGNWAGGTITAAYGGTGIASYATGSILYASAATTLTALGIGTSGQILTVSAGGIPEWAAAPITLPSQTGQNGKFLTTDGSTASWATIPVTSAATATTLGTVYGITNSAGVGLTAIGYNALLSNTFGTYNVAIGLEALYYNTDGDRNVAVGYDALFNNTSGDNNIAIGSQALNDNTIANSNIAIGYKALTASVGISRNVAIGYESFLVLTSAGLANNENTAVGYQSGYSSTNTAYSTFIGSLAGYGNTTGQSNTYLGYSAASNATTGSNNIAVGFNAQLSSVSTSNEIVIGDGNITTFRVPGLGINWTAATVPTGGGGDPKPQIFMLMGA